MEQAGVVVTAGGGGGMNVIDIFDILVKGIGVWIIMFGVAREILRDGQAIAPQPIPTLIRWAACVTMFIAYGAIVAACPLVIWSAYWWAAPLLLPLTAIVIFIFGIVCDWTESFPKTPKGRQLQRQRRLSRWKLRVFHMIGYEGSAVKATSRSVLSWKSSGFKERWLWKRRSGEGPSDGVEDRWLDSP